MLNYKLTDLKYHMDSLMPEHICNSFIKFYDDHESQGYAHSEGSYKYTEKKGMKDNFKCINLSTLKVLDDKFKEPFEVAQRYIAIVIANYVFHIQKTLCSTFSDKLIKNTSNIRIIKYGVGECIKDHNDINLTERCSVTINLNENYKGGEFRFFNGNIKETLKTGEAMIFPAEPIWIHGTEPVTEGARYSINCFLHP